MNRSSFNWSTNSVFDSTIGSITPATAGQSPQTPVGFRALLTSFGLAGLALNTMTMALIASYGPLRKCSTYVYIFALSGVDFLSSLCLCLTTLMEYRRTPLDGNSVLDNFMCRFWYRKGVLWASIHASVYLVLAVSMERCVAVVKPIFYKTKFSKKKIYPSLIISVFIVLGPVSIMPQTLWVVHIDNLGICLEFTNKVSDEVNRLIGWYNILMSYFIPLAVLMLLYAWIAWTLHRRAKVNGRSHNGDDNFASGTAATRNNPSTTLPSIESKPGTNEGESSIAVIAKENSENFKIKAKAEQSTKNSSMSARDGVLKNSLWIALCYVCCYTVNQIFYFLTSLGLVALDSGRNFRFTLVILHCCLNPVIYCIKLKVFRQGVVWLFRDKVKKRVLSLRGL